MPESVWIGIGQTGCMDSDSFISLRHGGLDFSGGPLVMGILNVTPDSFSDGGRFDDPESAVAWAGEMVLAGAAIVDVGAESTRPGSEEVPPAVQIDRACPVIERIRRAHAHVAVSIDTRSAEVAAAAIDAGADIINDVSALRDDADMSDVAKQAGAAVVLMHMRGRPQTMQELPQYDDVVQEVIAFLRARIVAAIRAGIDENRLIVDPGIGFGKTAAHNIDLLRRIDEFAVLGRPLLIGLSRKRFLGEITGLTAPADRDAASLAGALWSASKGGKIIRTHAVAETVQALKVWNAVAGESTDSGGPGSGQT